MEESKNAEQSPRTIPHVLVVSAGGAQHAFEMESREKALEVARRALEHGFVEIENERVYLLVGGPKAGTGFIIMSKSDVMEQQLAAQRASAQVAQTRQQLIRPR
jgi:hypothetical protein